MRISLPELSGLMGLDEAERAAVQYVGLLACVGCFADAHEQVRPLQQGCPGL